MASLLFAPGTNKISEQYLPDPVVPVAQDLASVLAVGASTGGITIQANTASNDGEMTTDILNVSQLKPLGFPVITEIGVQADLVFASPAKVRFEGEALIESDTAEYKLVGVQQASPALADVLAYNPTTGEVFYQPVGAGETQVNNVDTPAGDSSLTITPTTGDVKISLPVVATAGTYTNPDSITIDDRGRVSEILEGSAKVVSVSAGTNISVSGTAVEPVVNLSISEAVNFNGENAQNVNAVIGATDAILGITSDRELFLTAGGPTPYIVADSELRIQTALTLTGLNCPLNAVGGTDTAGAVGQYLTSQGPGATPAWTTPSTGGAVDSVSAGTNISISGTATDPVVNVNIQSNLDMDGNELIEVSKIIGEFGENLEIKPSIGVLRLLADDGEAKLVIDNAGTNLLAPLTANTNPGTAGQYLTSGGAGVIPSWTTPSPAGGAVDSVSAGANINITGTASDPVVNLDESIGVKAVEGVAGFDLNITPALGQTTFLNDPSGNSQLAISATGVELGNTLSVNSQVIQGANLILGRSTGNLQITPGTGQDLTITNNDFTNAIRLPSNKTEPLDIRRNVNISDNDLFSVKTIFGTSTGNMTLQPFSSTEEIVMAGRVNFQEEIELSGTSGTSGQVLTTQGAGLAPIWTTVGGGGGSVNSVSGGTNISVSGTATDPIVNLDVSSSINMNTNNIINCANVAGTNSASPGSRVITVSATDEAVLASAGTAIVGLDSSISDLRIEVNNTTGSKKIELYPQNNPILINGSAGTSGQVLQSQGSSLPPIWASVSGAGVESVSAGTGITVGGTASNPVVSNAGVLSVSAGTGITLDGTGAEPVVNNDGVIELTAGANITITGTKSNYTITASGGGGGGGVDNPMTSDLDANNFRITNLDEITPGSSSDLDIALPTLGQMIIKNDGVAKVSLGGSSVATFNAGGTTLPAIANAPALSAVADTSINTYGLQKEAFVANVDNLDGSITVSEEPFTPGTLRQKVVSLPAVGTAGTYNLVKSIQTDTKGRVLFADSYTTGPVESVSAGNGISIAGTDINPQVVNEGVIELTAGTGITVSGTKNNYTVANDGVLSVSAGTGITVGGTAQNPEISASPSGIYVNVLYVNEGVNDIQTAVNSATGGTQIVIGSGSYAGSTLAISNKSNIALIAPPRGQGTIAELASGRGLALESSSTGSITVANLQIEGQMSLGGSGNNYFTNLQALNGVVVENGATGNYFFADCEIAGLVVVPPTFSGVIAFNACNFQGATFAINPTSPLQVQFALCFNLPTTRPALATYGSTNADTSLVITTDTNLVRLAGQYGTAGQVLTSQGDSASAIWADAGGGGAVESVSAGTGITVGGTSTDPVVSNDGVIELTAGANMSLTGTKENYTITSQQTIVGDTVDINVRNNSSTVNHGVGSVIFGNTASFGAYPLVQTFDNQPAGQANIAIGVCSMPTLATTTTSPFNNVALGFLSGPFPRSSVVSDVSIQRNTCLGQQTLANVAVSSTDNVAVGFLAGSGAEGGNQNTLVGARAYQNSVGTGGGNTCVGFEAGVACNGSGNTQIGFLAGRSVGGFENTMIGFDNGLLCGGNDNVYIGNRTAHRIIGSQNIILGSSVAQFATNTTINQQFRVGYFGRSDYIVGDMNANTFNMTGLATFGDLALSGATVEATAGASSGQNLRILINGTYYKIELKADV
jgi:hypothetical protein